MGKFLKKSSGFTIIELLIYISIVAVATTIFTSFTVDVVRAAGRALAVKEVSQGSRLILSRITQEIKTAKSVSAIDSDSIQLIDVSGSPVTISFDSVNHAVSYSDSNGSSLISPTTVRVTNLQFEQLTPNTVSFSLALAQKRANATVREQFSLSFNDVAVTLRPALY